MGFGQNKGDAMKFQIFIITGPDEKRKHQKIRGFTRLEDVCAAAIGLLAVYRGEKDYVSVYLSGGRGRSSDHLASLSARWNDSLAKVLENARRQLAIKVTEIKANKARMAWLKSKDAADKTFSARFFATVPVENSREHQYVNQAAITAFSKNDFALAEKLMEGQP